MGSGGGHSNTDLRMLSRLSSLCIFFSSVHLSGCVPCVYLRIARPLGSRARKDVIVVAGSGKSYGRATADAERVPHCGTHDRRRTGSHFGIQEFQDQIQADFEAA